MNFTKDERKSWPIAMQLGWNNAAYCAIHPDWPLRSGQEIVNTFSKPEIQISQYDEGVRRFHSASHD